MQTFSPDKPVLYRFERVLYGIIMALPDGNWHCAVVSEGGKPARHNHMKSRPYDIYINVTTDTCAWTDVRIETLTWHFGLPWLSQRNKELKFSRYVPVEEVVDASVKVILELLCQAVITA